MARVTPQVRALYDMCAIALVEGRADLDGADDVGFDIDMPLFTVGHTAQLADMHPQTLRQYDRLGLVTPQRTEGAGTRCATSTGWFRRSGSARMEASIWPVSRGFWSLKRKTANCADRTNGCVSRRIPVSSQLTRMVASCK